MGTSLGAYELNHECASTSTFNRHFCVIHWRLRYQFFVTVESKTQPYSKSIVKGVYWVRKKGLSKNEFTISLEFDNVLYFYQACP